jgi:hypothetical protein
MEHKHPYISAAGFLPLLFLIETSTQFCSDHERRPGESAAPWHHFFRVRPSSRNRSVGAFRGPDPIITTRKACHQNPLLSSHHLVWTSFCDAVGTRTPLYRPLVVVGRCATITAKAETNGVLAVVVFVVFRSSSNAGREVSGLHRATTT